MLLTPASTSSLLSPLRSLGTAAFRLASRLRGERAIHARGRTLTGRVRVPGGAGTGAALLDSPGEYDALVRVSRSAGLPLPLPDVLGLAIRVLDAHGPGEHQDLLLDSTLERPLLRRLPVLGRDHLRPLHGSLLPYDVAGRRLLLGARGLPGQGPATLDDLPDRFELELLLATPHGPWQRWAVLTTEGVLPAPGGRRTRFNPWTTGGGIRPAGPWQQWRRRAYDASHVAPDER
jgi:hypothetical protein